MKINGFEIVALLPIMNVAGEIDDWVIMGERHREHAVQGSHTETVTARVKTLADREWYWGHYFAGLNARHDALMDVHKRWSEATAGYFCPIPDTDTLRAHRADALHCEGEVPDGWGCVLRPGHLGKCASSLPRQ